MQLLEKQIESQSMGLIFVRQEWELSIRTSKSMILHFFKLLQQQQLKIKHFVLQNEKPTVQSLKVPLYWKDWK